MRAAEPGKLALNIKKWRDAMYFKRDARPKVPVDFRGLSEEQAQAAVKALTTAEVDLTVKDLRSREIVRKKKLHHRCVDRRCRRARACTAGDQCCVCINVAGMNVAGMGRRGRKRIGALWRRRRMRI
jgi:hypothetical protein